jgi:hypothetical protein
MWIVKAGRFGQSRMHAWNIDKDVAALENPSSVVAFQTTAAPAKRR